MNAGKPRAGKERPVCVLIATRGADGLTHLALLAISSPPPGSGQTAIEVPEIERRRAGLDAGKRAWITTSEYNYDVAERSWYLDANQSPLGRFSKPFMIRVAAEVTPVFRKPEARVDRR